MFIKLESGQCHVSVMIKIIQMKDLQSHNCGQFLKIRGKGGEYEPFECLLFLFLFSCCFGMPIFPLACVHLSH